MSAAFEGVLVVGASGRVGRMLARGWAGMGLLPTLQHRGQGLDISLPQLRWDGQAPLPRERFRTMVVLAGIVPGKGDLGGNRTIAAACLSAAAAAGIEQVLLASSSAVYGSNAGADFSEDDQTRPINDYGRAKLAMEAEAVSFRQRGLRVCCIRIGNVAGADALLAKAPAQAKVLLDQFADAGGPVRSYIGPQTMAGVLVKLAGAELPDVLNLAAPRPVAMADLARAADLDWGWQNAPASAIQRITMDCGRLARLYDFRETESSAKAMVAEWRACRDVR